ncbi:capsule assembly Wzi family protein [Zhouia spongiae]|uniref:Capsule assembly Wzi family protein n=1 Tax=Zhouia spongiae TaxID=2202721 RepID=A0ABY3YJD0_9FLAO|nr:capsule assembly Wzi family protein [Zhouia spongiae]UNY97909.1 capsule assembly Wzi family protein [Zhouia spongiae]
MKYKHIVRSLLLTLPTFLLAQETEFSGRITLGGYASVRDSLPFWMANNTYGRMEEDTRVMGLAEVKLQHRLGVQSFLEAGTGLLFNDAAAPVLRGDSWYLQYQNKWFGVIGGKKQRPTTYGGLSTSGESILWSDNARPLPGVYAYTTKPIALGKSEKFLIDAYWGEYLMDDDRYVDNARVHSKGLTFIYRFNPRTELSIGLEHVAQWAGTSTTTGKQPSGFKDYLKIITGSSGGEGAVGGDQINALGNSIGSYRVRFKKQYDHFNLELFWNSVFEDRSGRELNNLPDGRYGVYLAKKQPTGLVHHMLYEFYYMKSHSDGAPFFSTGDDYFNNYVYQSGWTYHQHTIGSPFFLPYSNGVGIANNRFMAHHLGIGGNVKELPYRLLLSYNRNYGRRPRGTIMQEGKNVFSSRLDLKLPIHFAELKVLMGADFGETFKPKYAAGLQLVKEF